MSKTWKKRKSWDEDDDSYDRQKRIREEQRRLNRLKKESDGNEQFDSRPKIKYSNY